MSELDGNSQLVTGNPQLNPRKDNRKCQFHIVIKLLRSLSFIRMNVL